MNAGGTIVRVDDHVVHVAGLDACRLGEVVELGHDAWGVASCLERDEVSVSLLERGAGALIGLRATATGHPLEIPVGHGLRGRQLDPLGRPLDGGASLTALPRRQANGRPPRLLEFQRGTRPLVTGVKAIDVFFPVHHGERLGIVGPPLSCDRRSSDLEKFASRDWIPTAVHPTQTINGATRA